MTSINPDMASVEREPDLFVVPQIDVPSSTPSASQRMWISLVHWDLFELRPGAIDQHEFLAFASDNAALESFCRSLPRDAALRLLGLLGQIKSKRG